MPGVGSLRWACTFHIFCADFICVGHPTQTRFLVEYGLKSVIRGDVRTYIGKVIHSWLMLQYLAAAGVHEC